ncbi:MAG: cyanophycin synthetase [Planctomycetia bacterium]|nr:cyanophycin synthetase [Planctomycetia bacterium]
MEIRRIWALRGPNYWANFPVLEALVDLGDLHDRASDEIPGFNERLKAWMPTLVRHRCSVGEPGGFFLRLDRGTYLAHILEHVALELQTLADSHCGFGKARAASEDGVYRVVVKYREEGVGRAALELGRRICLAAVHDQPCDIAGEIERLRELNYDLRLGPSTAAIVAAARERDIPAIRLNLSSLVQLGHGSRARRICTAETDRTSALAESIAQDKQLTRSLLHAVGVPVPKGRPVDDAEDAWRATEEIGTPVVVKPQYGNHGRGVATNLSTREQVIAAYHAACEEGSHIIVEQYAPGEDHRLLVIGDRLVAAARREPAHVIGDGQHTITELVAEVNRDPRRSDGHSTVLSFIKLDTVGLAVLAEQAFSPTSVPAAGVKVLIRRNGNLSTGGTATDVTDLVHPEVAANAVDAARMIGLDIAGVDVVACDIGQPLTPQRGMIVEVNAGPGLRMHIDPSLGQPRPVGETIVSTLFGELREDISDGQEGRIPIIGVSGDQGATEVCRLTAELLSAGGTHVGLVTESGAWVDGRAIDPDAAATIGVSPESADDAVTSKEHWAVRAMLLNPRVEAIVAEVTPLGILTAGLGYDRGSVGVVTSVPTGPLADTADLAEAARRADTADLEEMEPRVRLYACVADAVLRSGTVVLNADDPNVLTLAAECQANVILVSRDEKSPAVAEHCRAGGRAVTIAGGKLAMIHGEQRELVPLDKDDVSDALRSTVILAAAAAAWGVGLTPAEIRQRLAESLAAVGAMTAPAV